MYNYKVELIRVVDGDTVDFRVWMGFHDYRVERFRLNGVNAWELHSPFENDRQKALQGKEFVENVLTKATYIEINSHKTEKYGRWLADVFYDLDGQRYNLSSELLRMGFAQEYHGG